MQWSIIQQRCSWIILHFLRRKREENSYLRRVKKKLLLCLLSRWATSRRKRSIKSIKKRENGIYFTRKMRTILPKYALCPLKHNSCPPQNDPLKKENDYLILGPDVRSHCWHILTFLMVIGFLRLFCFASLWRKYSDDEILVILFYTSRGRK